MGDLLKARPAINDGEIVYQPAKNSDAYVMLVLYEKTIKWITKSEEAAKAANLAYNKAEASKEDATL